MAYKKERLEKNIKREISTIILNDTKDERLKFVTITKVILTDDLSIATIYYTILGNDNQIEKTSQNLLDAKGYIKTILSKKLKVRKTPDLKFEYDKSYEYGNRIEEILRSLDK